MPRESDVRGDRAHKKRIERKQMEAKKRAALRTVLRSDELVNLRTLVSLSMRGLDDDWKRIAAGLQKKLGVMLAESDLLG